MSLAFWNYLKRPKAYGLLVVMLDAVLQQQRVQLFFGTGEHMDEFEAFETKSFVSHLLSELCLVLSLILSGNLVGNLTSV
jgi:hypothetical protein